MSRAWLAGMAFGFVTGCAKPSAASSAKQSEATEIGPRRTPLPLRPALHVTTPNTLGCTSRPTPPRPVSSDWTICPFPGEADRRDVHTADVLLELCVDERGVATSGAVVRDPGYGFAQAALHCVAKFQFRPGLDEYGTPVPGRLTMRIVFRR